MQADELRGELDGRCRACGTREAVASGEAGTTFGNGDGTHDDSLARARGRSMVDTERGWAMTVDARRVAFCGLGQLGGPVCDVLLGSVHRVTVYDPRPDAVAPRVAAGAHPAASPADAARDADVSIIFVRDDAQALDAVTGPQGILAGAPRGSVVVLHSTVAPATVRTLDLACRGAHVGFVDAGVSRGGERSPGSLYAMCGGDAEVIDAVRPVLGVYCTDIVRFGDTGAGMRAKLVRNAIRYAVWAVQHEGFALAEAAGLDLRAMEHLYRATFGTVADDDVVLRRGTTVPLSPRDTTADPAQLAFLRDIVLLGWKDLDDALHLAHEIGHDVPMIRHTRTALGPAFGLALDDATEDAHTAHVDER